MRPLRAGLALVLAALTLSGCMKLELELFVADDTVSGSFIYAVERELLATGQKSASQTIEDALKGVGAMPKGSRTETYEDAKYYGRKVIFDKMPLAEFNRKDGSGPRIVHSGGLYTFTLDGDTSTFDLGEGAQVYGYRAILDEAEVRIAITFPGKVIERDNLATLDGNTVNWRVKLRSKHQFKAVAEEPPSFPLLIVAGVGAVAVIALVAGLILFAVSRRKRRADRTVDPQPVMTAPLG